jgi:hypothetical protein
LSREKVGTADAASWAQREAANAGASFAWKTPTLRAERALVADDRATEERAALRRAIATWISFADR